MLPVGGSAFHSGDPPHLADDVHRMLHLGHSVSPVAVNRRHIAGRPMRHEDAGMPTPDVEVHHISRLRQREIDRRVMIGKVVCAGRIVGERRPTILRHLADEGCTPRPSRPREERGPLALLYEEPLVGSHRDFMLADELGRTADNRRPRDQHVTALSGLNAVVMRKLSLLRRNASRTRHL